ncbi:MAG: glycosyltransferase [Pirellulales bacterium]
MNEPLVSIVMPVYNADRFLVEALASMQAQTFKDWELICVNDGCTDDSGRILNWFASIEPRMRLINQNNRGLVGALNRGVEAVHGSLIARMDADDIAVPDRFEKQVAFLREHPLHVAVGGSILQMDVDSDPLSLESLPGDHEVIEERLLTRRTGMFHPTVMMRSADVFAVGAYRVEYEWVEDHDLWLRLAQRGRLANLPDLLLAYRLHSTSVCWSKSDGQRRKVNDVLREAYRVRNRELPGSVILESNVSRSKAGHGKWARAAAKGGLVHSALKHLKAMQTENVSNLYKLRMTTEVLLRLLMAAPRSLVQRVPQVPRFPDAVEAYQSHIAATAKQCA